MRPPPRAGQGEPRALGSIMLSLADRRRPTRVDALEPVAAGNAAALPSGALGSPARERQLVTVNPIARCGELAGLGDSQRSLGLTTNCRGEEGQIR
jgi:hypothetical protein